jgi:hypothetical protein
MAMIYCILHACISSTWTGLTAYTGSKSSLKLTKRSDVRTTVERIKVRKPEPRLRDKTQPIDDFLWMTACLENAAKGRLKTAWQIYAAMR